MDPNKTRVVSIRIPDENVKKDTGTHIVLKDGTQLEKSSVSPPPIFEVTEDTHAYFDPHGEFDISGPNVIDLKKGTRVDLMACQLNEQYGFSPVRFTHVISTGDRVEDYVYVRNSVLKHISGNLGIRA